MSGSAKDSRAPLSDELSLSVLDAMGQYVVVMDRRGMVLYLNDPAREFLELMGRDHESCEGQPAERILPIATPLAKRAMEGEEFARGEGRVLDKGKELFFEITPLMHKGELAGAVVSLQPHERFEKMALRLDVYQRLSRQLQAIFDSSSDGIWVTDGKGFITNVNTASLELNGLESENLIGKNIKTIVARGGVDQAVTLEVMAQKRQISLIQHIRNTNRQILATGTPVFDDQGELALVVVNERDLTELNNLRRDLAIAKQSQEKVRNELESLYVLELERSGIVAESAAMRQALATALKLAQLGVSKILISGESGVGKGLLAKFLHTSSPRKDKPFLSINCAALPESLFEAELFGYEEGAFTGAREGGRVGLMGLARDGSLFMDEIGELPLALQAKLLTCLDQDEYIPVGGEKPVPVDCSLIFATNQDLEALVRQKKFREDLYYRICSFTVHIPPLRERLEDVFELARVFLGTFNSQFGAKKYLTADALDLLQGHQFFGNVRELRSLIRKGVVMHEDDDLTGYLEKYLDSPTEARDGGSLSLPEKLERVERELLAKAKAMHASTREMADYLGINQSTVVRKLKKHGLA